MNMLATTLKSNPAPFAFILAKLVANCMKVVIQSDTGTPTRGTRPDMKKRRIMGQRLHPGKRKASKSHLFIQNTQSRCFTE